MSIREDLHFINNAADFGLGAPDYCAAYQRVWKAVNQISELEAKLQAAEEQLKEWTDNENGENYDFQIQSLLLRQTVEERDEARSRAEAAEEASEKTLAIFEDQRERFGKCREERTALQAEVARLKAQAVQYRPENELTLILEQQDKDIARLQAEVARMTVKIER